jgi:hypothetical protein
MDTGKAEKHFMPLAANSSVICVQGGHGTGIRVAKITCAVGEVWDSARYGHVASYCYFIGFLKSLAMKLVRRLEALYGC